MKLLHITLLALSILVVSGCKKNDKPAEDEKKTQADDSKSSAKVKKGEPPAKKSDDKPVELASVGAVTFEQAVASMGKSAPHRLVTRAPKLIEAGLVDLAMTAMPKDARANYDRFVASSGFNPITSAAGMLIYADGDIGKFKTARPTIVIGVTGTITEKVIDELDELSGDDDKNDIDSEEFMRVVFLADLSKQVRTKLLAEFREVDAGEPPVEIEAVGDAAVIASHGKVSLRYGYLWSGGLVFGEMPKQAGTPVAGARKALKPLLDALNVASSAKGQPSDVVISGRGAARGTSAQFSVKIDDKIRLNVKATPGAASMPEVTKIVAALPMLKEKPEAMMGEAPPEAESLIRLLVANTEATLVDKALTMDVNVDTKAFKKALEPMLDKK